MSYSEHNRWPEGTPQHVKVLQAQEVEINFLRQTILLQHDTNRCLLDARDALRAALEGIIDRYDDDKANGTDWFTILDADRAALGGGK